ncbi:MAG: ELWxxDGT repeat protein [Planctomycetota bacterium]
MRLFAVPFLPFVAVLWTSSGSLPGQDARLLKDVSLTPQADSSSLPASFTPVQRGLVFGAWRHDSGRELWFSDGTTAGTTLVRDLVPGADSGYLGPSIGLRGVALFVADDHVHGAELWASDGSAAGTQLIADLRPGADGSSPRDLLAASTFVWFTADDGVHGREVWRTDGTAAGTTLLLDIAPGAAGNVTNLVAVGEELWFCADDGVHGAELWHSDGTTQGTVMVADIEPGAGSSTPGSFAHFGAEVYFAATTVANGRELWRSDGSTAGTALFADIRSGSDSSSPHELVTVDLTLFFVANRGLPFETNELWTLRSGQLTRLRDIDPNIGTRPEQLTAVAGLLYYTAFHSFYGREPWVSDGTATGTHLVGDLNGTFSDSAPSDLRAIGDTLWLCADGIGTGREAFVAHLGIAHPVADLHPGLSSSTPADFALLAQTGEVVFAATSPTVGREPWRSDGTAAGTVLMANIETPIPGSTIGSEPQQMKDALGTLYFTADDGVHGYELWRSDGSESGTRLVADINPAIGGTLPQLQVAIDENLYFGADDGVHGYELWRASPAGAEMVVDVSPGSVSGLGGPLCAIGARMFFAGNDGQSGAELWVTTGTSASTSRIVDLRPGLGSSSPRALTNVSGALYFFADAVGASTLELWRSDGTASGTVMVRDFASGPQLGVLRMVALGRIALFLAGPTTAYELWRSDGTAAGTFKLADLGAGVFGVPPDLAVWNGRAWFEADDGVHGRELWVTDGTLPGTALFADIAAGAAGSDIEVLTAGVDRLWFFAVDARGVAAWCSDGTLAGTQRLIDLAPYPFLLSSLWSIVPTGTRRVCMRAEDPIFGNSLFVSDGTPTGTHRVDVQLAASGPFAEPVAFSNGRLFFVGDDGVHGREPFVYFPGASAQRVGMRCTTTSPAPLLDATDPILGGQSQINATNGPLGSVALLLFGVQTPAPISILGCRVLIDPLAFMPITTPSAAGAMPIPDLPALLGTGLALQTWYLSPAPTLQVASSNAVLLRLGR